MLILFLLLGIVLGDIIRDFRSKKLIHAHTISREGDISALSQSNLLRVQNDLKSGVCLDVGDSLEHGKMLTLSEVELLKSMMDIPLVLKHATKRQFLKEMKKEGYISSVKDRKRNQMLVTSHTPQGADGFVFFTLGPASHPIAGFLANAKDQVVIQISLDDYLTESGGFSGPLKHLIFGEHHFAYRDYVWTESSFKQSIRTVNFFKKGGMRKKYTYRRPDGTVKTRTVKYMDELTFGRNIISFYRYNAILELRCIGGDYRREILNNLNRTKIESFLSFIYHSSSFESRLPLSFPLSSPHSITIPPIPSASIEPIAYNVSLDYDHLIRNKAIGSILQMINETALNMKGSIWGGFLLVAIELNNWELSRILIDSFPVVIINQEYFVFIYSKLLMKKQYELSSSLRYAIPSKFDDDVVLLEDKHACGLFKNYNVTSEALSSSLKCGGVDAFLTLSRVYWWSANYTLSLSFFHENDLIQDLLRLEKAYQRIGHSLVEDGHKSMFFLIEEHLLKSKQKKGETLEECANRLGLSYLSLFYKHGIEQYGAVYLVKDKRERYLVSSDVPKIFALPSSEINVHSQVTPIFDDDIIEAFVANVGYDPVILSFDKTSLIVNKTIIHLVELTVDKPFHGTVQLYNHWVKKEQLLDVIDLNELDYLYVKYFFSGKPSDQLEMIKSRWEKILELVNPLNETVLMEQLDRYGSSVLLPETFWEYYNIRGLTKAARDAIMKHARAFWKPIKSAENYKRVLEIGSLSDMNVLLPLIMEEAENVELLVAYLYFGAGKNMKFPSNQNYNKTFVSDVLDYIYWGQFSDRDKFRMVVRMSHLCMELPMEKPDVDLSRFVGPDKDLSAIFEDEMGDDYQMGFPHFAQVLTKESILRNIDSIFALANDSTCPLLLEVLDYEIDLPECSYEGLKTVSFEAIKRLVTNGTVLNDFSDRFILDALRRKHYSFLEQYVGISRSTIPIRRLALNKEQVILVLKYQLGISDIDPPFAFNASDLLFIDFDYLKEKLVSFFDMEEKTAVFFGQLFLTAKSHGIYYLTVTEFVGVLGDLRFNIIIIIGQSMATIDLSEEYFQGQDLDFSDYPCASSYPSSNNALAYFQVMHTKDLDHALWCSLTEGLPSSVSWSLFTRGGRIKNKFISIVEKLREKKMMRNHNYTALISIGETMFQILSFEKVNLTGPEYVYGGYYSPSSLSVLAKRESMAEKGTIPFLLGLYAERGYLNSLKEFFASHSIDLEQINLLAIKSAYEGEIPVLEYLIQQGANVDSKNLLLLNTVLSGKINIVKSLFFEYEFEDEWKNIALKNALRIANFNLVRFLISRGAAINHRFISLVARKVDIFRLAYTRQLNEKNKLLSISLRKLYYFANSRRYTELAKFLDPAYKSIIRPLYLPKVQEEHLSLDLDSRVLNYSMLIAAHKRQSALVLKLIEQGADPGYANDAIFGDLVMDESFMKTHFKVEDRLGTTESAGAVVDNASFFMKLISNMWRNKFVLLPKKPSNLRLMSFNVHMLKPVRGFPRYSSAAPFTVIASVNPDVIFIQEAIMEMVPVMQAKGYNYFTFCRYDRYLMNAIFSKLPLSNIERFTHKTTMKCLIKAQINNITVVNLHLHSEHSQDSNRFFEAKFFSGLLNRWGNLVIGGDFNDVAMSRSVQIFKRNHTSVFEACGIAEPAFTCRVGTTVDHVMVSKGVKIDNAFVVHSVASDHIPIVAELVI